MKNTESSTADSLTALNEWVVNVMRDMNDDVCGDLEKTGAEAQLSSFVQNRTSALHKLVSAAAKKEEKDVKIRAVTVRSSYRLASTYMRPIYSFPTDLGEHIEKPEIQKPFSFEISGSQSPFEKIFDLHGCGGTKPTECAMGVYQITGDVSGNESSSTSFGERIEGFWSSLAGHEELAKIVAEDHPHSKYFCLFAVRRKESHPNRFEADSMVAIYFSIKLGQRKITEFVETLRGKQPVLIAADLFTGIDLIQNVDANIFRARGMELVAELVPVFDRPDISPADKISFAIERLKLMLKGHLVGRHGASNGNLEVHYVSTTFQLETNARSDNRQRRFLPMFRIYPNAYCLKNPLGALRIAHQKIPSASKYLLHQYMESAGNLVMDTAIYEMHMQSAATLGVPLEECIDLNQRYSETTDAFSKVIEGLDTIDEASWRDFVCPRLPHGEDTKNGRAGIRDMLLLSRFDHSINELLFSSSEEVGGKKTPWDCLNQQVNANEPNQSLAAFVIEGAPLFYQDENVRLKQLPRGILAIESKQVDPFTDSDLKSLRAVSRGIAALIRRITKDNSSLDFRRALMRTESDLTLGGRSPEEFNLLKRLLFAIRKVDLDELRKLIKSEPGRKSLEDEFHLDEPSISLLKKLVAGLAGGRVEGSPVEGQSDVEAILRQRIPEAIKIICSEDARSCVTSELVDLVESFTENEAYAGYFSSISQALGSRVGINGLPTFTLLKSGYSAVGVFSAQKDNEMRQVVKLSSSDKLLKELECYRRYVRYQILLAARIPADGFAFDNNGDFGISRATEGFKTLGKLPDKYERKSYGVLVSDLVSGEIDTEHFKDMPPQVVKTLLSTLVSCYSDTTWAVDGPGHFVAGKGPAVEIQQIIEKNAVEPVRDICRALINLVGRNQSLWQESNADSQRHHFAQNLVRSSFRLPTTDLPAPEDTTEAARLRLLNQAGQFYKLLPGNSSIDLNDSWKGEGLSMGDSAAENLVATIHGDMSARNLAWAGSIGHFFYIDFEHVGPGFSGADAFRLVINLMIDSYSGAIELNLKGDGPRVLYDSIDATINFISRFYDFFACEDFDVESVRQMPNGGDVTPSTLSKTYTELSLAKAVKRCLNEIYPNELELNRAFKDPLLSVTCTLLNLVRYSKDPYQQSDEFGLFVSYALSMAALKEFEYSARNLSIETDDFSFLNSSLVETSVVEIIDAVQAEAQDKKKQQFYIRFLISAKILESTIARASD